jgi:hypothetical protein
MDSLTIEQQFALRATEEQVKTASAEELGKLVLEMHRLLMIKDAWIKELMRKSLGV